MKICDFVNSELERIRSEANFTKYELFLFELRARDMPLEQCAEIMNVSISAIKAEAQGKSLDQYIINCIERE